MKHAALIALQHHEKYDGTGYPYGLVGEEIHIAGRVVAIADVFDSLGSKRSYKKAWELDQIIEYFREQRGCHFDPVLVDILLDNLDEITAISQRIEV
jgi:response regulator RpfG family c-di-GMP phosphodiesterase